MSNITNTERVAVALFGWSASPPRCDWTHGRVFSGGKKMYSETEFPDFTDERLAPYWCDRMQRELAGKGLFPKYCRELAKDRFVFISDPVCDVGEILLLATPAQRLEAAVRVLDEVGL